VIRDIKTITMGDGLIRETITINSNMATQRGSWQAYSDFDKTMRSCLDSMLFRNKHSNFDSLTCVHNGTNWVFTVITETEAVTETGIKNG
jgi:hypothetical protein